MPLRRGNLSGKRAGVDGGAEWTLRRLPFPGLGNAIVTPEDRLPDFDLAARAVCRRVHQRPKILNESLPDAGPTRAPSQPTREPRRCPGVHPNRPSGLSAGFDPRLRSRLFGPRARILWGDGLTGGGRPIRTRGPSAKGKAMGLRLSCR